MRTAPIQHKASLKGADIDNDNHQVIRHLLYTLANVPLMLLNLHSKQELMQ